MDFLVAGGARSSSVTLRKYDLDGQPLGTYDTGSTVWAVAIDSEVNIIAGGNHGGSPSRSLRKLDKDLNLIWEITTGTSATVNGIAIDSEDNIIVGVARQSANDFKTVIKYDKNGQELWSDNSHGLLCENVAVDSNDNVIAVYRRDDDITVRKFDPDGNELWPFDHGANTLGAFVNKDDEIIISGVRSDDISNRKLGADGNEIWTFEHGATTRHMIQTANDKLVVVGAAGTNFRNIRYLDLEFNEIWHSNIGISHYRVVEHSKSNSLTVVGAVSSNRMIWTFDIEGELLWDDDHGGTNPLYTVAIYEDIPEDIPPDPGGGGAYQTATFQLVSVDAVGNVIPNKAGTINQVMQSSLEQRVAFDPANPSTVGWPRLQTYLNREEDNGRVLKHIDQSSVVTGSE